MVELELVVEEHLVKEIYEDLLVVSACDLAVPLKLQLVPCYFHRILLIPYVNFVFAGDYFTSK